MSETYLDADEQPIQKGDRVQLVGSAEGTGLGTIRFISDPDGDTDDEGRMFGIPPRVYLAGDPEPDFPEGWEDDFIMSWTATGPWDSYGAPYICEEIRKLPAASCLNVEHNELTCQVAGLPPAQWCSNCSKTTTEGDQ